MNGYVLPVGLPPAPNDSPEPDTNNSDQSATAPPESTNGTAPAGALQGRDPDLIFEGEKILVNGKEYIVQKDDTLSGIAVKFGLAGKGNQQEILNAVVKLAKENGMDLAKMDQRGFKGLEPTATSPQPPNGGATAKVRVSADGTTAPNNTPGSPLDESSSGGPPKSTTGATDNPPLKSPKLSDRDSAGLEGGPVTGPRLQSIPMNNLPDGNSQMLTPWQVERAQEILRGIDASSNKPDDYFRQGGIHLNDQDKAILNWYMKEVLEIAAVPSTGGGDIVNA